MTITNVKIYTMEGEDKIISRGWLSFENGKITALGEGDYTGGGEIIDGKGAGLFPALSTATLISAS